MVCCWHETCKESSGWTLIMGTGSLIGEYFAKIDTAAKTNITSSRHGSRYDYKVCSVQDVWRTRVK